MRTESARSDADQTRSRTARRLPIFVFGFLAAGIAVAGVVLERSMEDGARRRGGVEIDAVAALKVRGLQAWREASLRDIRSATVWKDLVLAARFLVDDPPDVGAGSLLREERLHEARRVLGDLALARGLERVAIVGEDMRVAVEVAPSGDAGPPLSAALVRRALAEHFATELAAVAGERSPRLEMAAEIVNAQVPAVIYARVDAGRPVAEIASGWPVPSESAESVIARRDGDAALFASEPRFLPGWAMKARIPIVEGDRGIVRAVAGEGVFEATDFRGTPILVASRRVPDSDWYVVSRVNVAEIEAPILGPARWVGALVLALLASGGVALAWWYRQERAHHADLARARRALEASEDRFRLALAGTHFVWDWDVEQGLLTADPDWARSVGLPYSALRGDPAAILARIVHPDDRAQVSDQLEAHLVGKAPRFEAEFRTRLPVGERWIRFRAGATERGPDGRARRLTGVLSDITEWRAMQSQLDRSERMASLGTLAAGVAHEINNPLTYVVSNLEILEQSLARERPELAEAARQAREGTERVREVVRGLRSFTRGGTTRGPVDVGAELQAAVRIARNEIQHRAALEVDIGPMPPVDARGRELGQVFLNLLVNAGQALPDDPSRRGRVRVSAGTDAEGRARIEIQDDGSGIPAEVLPRIFDPFFTTKPVGVGTGLGLAIAHNVVTAAGGTIEVESQVGMGSTFRVLLPSASAPAVPPPERSQGTPLPVRPGAESSAPVLVVDDEPLVARSIGRALQREGPVVLVGSAEEARGLFEAGERFRAVVCDLMMPGMTGMDLFEWVEGRDPALAARFVFITGGAFTHRARSFLDRTGAPCVDKPFEASKLREAVQRAASAGGEEARTAGA